MKNFPKYQQQRSIGDKGVSFVRYIIEHELNWIFRENHLESDFGIDGYIDIVGTENSVTGKSIAIQIKTGESFFKMRTQSGWTFYGEKKHLNYYANIEIPILIMIVNLDERKIYWELFEIDKTIQSKSGWTLFISDKNVLNESSKHKLLDISGDVIDYMPQIENHWEFSKELKKSDLILLNVGQKEILNLDTSPLMNLLKKLTVNDEMIKKSESKLSFFIDGYNNDTREIYEIPEIRAWMSKVFQDFKYWGYFLDIRKEFIKSAGLYFLILCLCDCKIISTNDDNSSKNVQYDVGQSIELMKQIFYWLNEFTDKYNISEEINRKKSDEISYVFTNHLR